VEVGILHSTQLRLRNLVHRTECRINPFKSLEWGMTLESSSCRGTIIPRGKLENWVAALPRTAQQLSRNVQTNLHALTLVSNIRSIGAYLSAHAPSASAAPQFTRTT
jgi:hypothetical protein